MRSRARSRAGDDHAQLFFFRIPRFFPVALELRVGTARSTASASAHHGFVRMLPLTQETAAAIVGRTTRRLQQLDRASEGPKRNADGTYPPAALGEWLRQQIMSELGVANDGAAYDHRAERARLTKAQADKTELEVLVLRADLISTPEALLQVQGMVGAMRAKLLSLPTKVAPLVAKTPADIAAAQEAIRVEVYEALDEIASDRFQDEIQKRIDRIRAGTESVGEPVNGATVARKSTSKRPRRVRA